MLQINKFGQPIGDPMPEWKACPTPADVTLTGRVCRLQRINLAKHFDDLFAAYQQWNERDFTYLYQEPFMNIDDYREYVVRMVKSTDPYYYAVIDLLTNKAVGTIALMSIDAANGVIEVGYVRFSPKLRQTTHSTEAQYLLMAYVFDQLGYRRYEWKCDIHNEPSRKAAERLGFIFEGIAHNSVVYKGRNLDLAWFAITSDRWPVLKTAFQAWLALENFDSQGRQIKSLVELRME